jgi:hypothetical protein
MLSHLGERKQRERRLAAVSWRIPMCPHIQRAPHERLRWARSRRTSLLSGSAARSAASIHSFARARHSSPEAIHTPNAKHIGCVPLNERKASVPRTKKPWIQFMTKGRRKIGDEPSCRVDLARVAPGEHSRHRFWNMKSCVLRHRATVWILDGRMQRQAIPR